MATKTNGALALLKRVFWDVDNVENEIDIGKSNDPKMKDLKESLKIVEEYEMKFVNNNSSKKGGKSGIVEKAEVDAAKAMKEASQKVSEREVDGLEK